MKLEPNIPEKTIWLRSKAQLLSSVPYPPSQPKWPVVWNLDQEGNWSEWGRCCGKQGTTFLTLAGLGLGYHRLPSDSGLQTCLSPRMLHGRHLERRALCWSQILFCHKAVTSLDTTQASYLGLPRKWGAGAFSAVEVLLLIITGEGDTHFLLLPLNKPTFLSCSCEEVPSLVSGPPDNEERAERFLPPSYILGFISEAKVAMPWGEDENPNRR